MKKLCLFDLDGTLTDSKTGILNSAQYALKAVGIKISDYTGNLNNLIGPPIRDAFRLIHPFTDTEVEEVVGKYREYFTEKGMFENQVYPGIMDMLAKLKSEGITMAIATSKVTVYAQRIAGHFGFTKYFDVIMGAELDGSRDSKSAVIRAALDELCIEGAQKIIMIGDREHDIIGAKETGIVGIGVTWGYGTRQELEAAGATNIVDSAEELSRVILS